MRCAAAKAASLPIAGPPAGVPSGGPPMMSSCAAHDHENKSISADYAPMSMTDTHGMTISWFAEAVLTLIVGHTGYSILYANGKAFLHTPLRCSKA